MRDLEKLPNPFVNMNFKKQLKLYLAHRELSASDLARAAKVPKQSISGWLAGNNPRDVRQVKAVSDALETTLDHLMFGNGIKEASSSDTDDVHSFIGDQWISGIFEVKLRRIKK